VAVAEELLDQSPDSDVVFVGTERGIEARVVPELGYPLELIEVSGIKTVGIWGAIKGVFRIPGSLWQSRKLLKRLEPDAVVGVGGYASGPVVLMARLMGVPTAILEQNSIPGLTNKILGKFVHRIFLAFEFTRKFFKAGKSVLSGNPIRKDIRAALTAGSNKTPSERPRLFITGGSQGAKAVNEMVVGAAKLLKDRGIEPVIVHQTGKISHDDTVNGYQEAGIDADVRAFISDMAAEYRQADLVIARSGATTVAELGVVGVPAILIPYPFAADNHQELNAAELAASGAAVMAKQSELSAEKLADLLAERFENRSLLSEMGSAMKAQGRPEAATTVVSWCLEQAEG
jgi:UDP-N-acetylglucosamine--N-acetylmuramyl-(pentapeptide) pyrophosphoryl-undecaprenol N-acetylglucosamine transferase